MGRDRQAMKPTDRWTETDKRRQGERDGKRPRDAQANRQRMRE